MNFEPFIGGIEFHNEMRSALGASARENTLAGTAMRGDFRTAQVKLEVIEKSAEAFDARIFACRRLRRDGLTPDPPGHRYTAKPIRRTDLQHRPVVHHRTPTIARSPLCRERHDRSSAKVVRGGRG